MAVKNGLRSHEHDVRSNVEWRFRNVNSDDKKSILQFICE
jgi:hypothetical protein